MITDLERNILMSSVYVTHIVWALTNHQWGMNENPH